MHSQRVEGAQAQVCAAFLGLALVSACFSAGTAAAEGQVSITTKWTPLVLEPSAVTVQGFESTLSLTLNADSRTYSGIYAYQAMVADPSEVTLTAQFPGGGHQSLPLRVRPGFQVSTTLYFEQPTACTETTLTPIFEPSGNVETALRRYFIAKAALEIRGDDSCGRIMKKVVTKAWLDRSNELVHLANFYRLSKEAADAYRAYDVAYVEKVEEAEQLIAVQYAIIWRNEALDNGSPKQASAINDRLISKLSSDPRLREIAKTDGVTLEALKNDPKIKAASVFGNTVTVTDRAGGNSNFSFKSDGTFVLRKSDTPDITGEWRVEDGKLCTFGQAHPNRFCAAIDANRKVGDSWIQNNALGQEIGVKIKAGN